MTIILDSVTFSNPVGSMIHGLPQVQDYQVAASRSVFWGVIGAQVNYSVPTFRALSIPVTLHNFASEAAIREHVYLIRQKHGTNGTLQVTNLQGTTVDWPLTAFIGFNESESPRFDGSGKHLWFQPGTLLFEQVAQ